jgi:alkylation response protein AidB-like acyl-CoA dehydrogenase
MDFTLTDEQQALQGLANQILTDKGTLLRLKELDASDDWFDRETWADFAAANLLGVAIAEEHGGLGLGFLEVCLILQEQGRRVVPMPLWATLVGGALPISMFGTDAQRTAYLPGVVEGTTVLTGAFEETGGDAEAPATTATRAGDGWTITGVKATVPAAHLAAAILVPATTPDGIGVFIVDPNAAGVTLGRQDTMSHEPRFEVTLSDVRVGADALLGGTLDDGATLRSILDHATVGLCAISSGCAQEAIRIAAEHVTNRKQFDRPLATFQAVGQRMADSFIDTQGIHLTMLGAASHLALGEAAREEVATAKYWAAEGGSRVGFAVLHVHGGISIDVDYPIHRYFLWLKENEFTLGAATPTLVRLGRMLAAS